MLLAGYGKVGIDIDKSMDTFNLATGDEFENPGQLPKYYGNCKERKPAP